MNFLNKKNEKKEKSHLAHFKNFSPNDSHKKCYGTGLINMYVYKMHEFEFAVETTNRIRISQMTQKERRERVSESESAKNLKA